MFMSLNRSKLHASDLFSQTSPLTTNHKQYHTIMLQSTCISTFTKTTVNQQINKFLTCYKGFIMLTHSTNILELLQDNPFMGSSEKHVHKYICLFFHYYLHMTLFCYEIYTTEFI